MCLNIIFALLLFFLVFLLCHLTLILLGPGVILEEFLLQLELVEFCDRRDWQHLEEMQDRIWNQSLIQQEKEQQSIHAKAVSMEFGTAAAAAVCPASSWERFDLGQVQLVSPEGKRDWKL